MRYKQSFKEKQELVRNSMLAAGLVSERFPGVSSIVFQITYYQRALDRVLMKRTLSFFPSNYACFHMECLRDGCTDGGFDLAPIVARLVKGRKKSIKGNISCKGTNEALSLSHASIAYEVTVEYREPVK